MTTGRINQNEGEGKGEGEGEEEGEGKGEEREMAESLRQAYDYWQDQNGRIFETSI